MAANARSEFSLLLPLALERAGIRVREFLLPLPLGEGWGEGLKVSERMTFLRSLSLGGMLSDRRNNSDAASAYSRTLAE